MPRKLKLESTGWRRAKAIARIIALATGVEVSSGSNCAIAKVASQVECCRKSVVGSWLK
jgi:hypothetical protein